MKKKLIALGVVCFTSSFLGLLCYNLVSKPDGYLYMDKDTKCVYAALDKDPDTYRKGTRLIFVYKA